MRLDDEEGELRELHLRHVETCLRQFSVNVKSIRFRFDVFGTSHWDGSDFLIELSPQGYKILKATGRGVMYGNDPAAGPVMETRTRSPEDVLDAVYQLEVDKVMSS